VVPSRGLRKRRDRPWPSVPRFIGPRARRAGKLFSMTGGEPPRLLVATKNSVFRFLTLLVLINNKTSNTHSQPTAFFISLGPHTEHWHRAQQAIKSPQMVPGLLKSIKDVFPGVP
jgi:hypothetical protein